MAFRHASAELPGIMDSIKRREELVPDGVPIEDHVGQILKLRTEGMSQAYSEAYFDALAPRMAAGYFAQQEGMRAEATASAMQDYQSAAANARSPQDVQRGMDAFRANYPQATPQEIELGVLLPAYKAAALKGDTLAMDAIGPHLQVDGNDKYPLEMQQAKAAYTTVIEGRRKAATDQVTSAFTNSIEGALAKGNIAEAQGFLAVGIEDGRADRQAMNILKNKVDAAAKEQERATRDEVENNVLGRFEGNVGRGMNPADALTDALTLARTLGQPADEALRTVLEGRNGLKEQIASAARMGPAGIEFFADLSSLLLSVKDDLDSRGFIAEQGRALDTVLRGQAGDAAELEAVGRMVSEGTSPLPPGLDSAYTKFLAMSGVIDVLPTGEYLGVTEPERMAAFAVQGQRLLPDAAGQAAQAFSVATGLDQLAVPARLYAAIYFRNPMLAQAIRSKMSDVGQVRADAMIAQLQLKRPSSTLIGAKGLEANPEFASAVMDAMGRANVLALTKSPLTDEQVRAALWGEGSPVTQGAARSGARSMIEGALPAGLDDNFAFGFGRGLGVTEEGVNELGRLIEHEYKIAGQLHPIEAARIAAAKDSAIRQFLHEHPPILWNGTVYVGPKAQYPFDDKMSKEMEGELDSMHTAGLLPESSAHYMSLYGPPVWRAEMQFTDERGNKRRGAWILPDPSGAPLSVRGVVFGFAPALPEGVSEEANFQKLKDEVTAKLDEQVKLRKSGQNIGLFQGMPVP